MMKFFIKSIFLKILKFKDVVILLCLVFALLFYSLLITHKIGKNYVKNTVQKKLYTVENDLIKKNNVYIKELKKNLSENYFFKDSEDGSYSSFLFKNDSLISWTTTRLKVKTQSLNPNETSLQVFGSAYAIARLDTFSCYKILSCFIVKNKYPFQNEYLTNWINPKLISSASVKLGVSKGLHNVYFKNNKFVFNLVYSEELVPSEYQSFIILVLFILSFIYFSSFIQSVLNRYLGNGLKSITLFISIILLLRMVIQVFEIPSVLYKSVFFQPTLYASSYFFPSIGDLILTTLSLVIVTYAYSIYVNMVVLRKKSFFGFTLKYINLMLFIACSFITYFIIKSLVFDSNISFNLVDVSEFTLYSLLGYFVVSLLFLVHYQLVKLLITGFLNQKLHMDKALLLSIYLIIALLIALFYEKLLAYFFLLTFFPFLLYVIINKYKSGAFALFVFNIIAFSFAVNIILYSSNNEMDRLKREVLLRQLSITEDPELEYQFSLSEQQAYHDSNLVSLFLQNNVSYDSISGYISNNYLLGSKIQKKYDIQLTICNETDQLIVKPDNIQYNCKQFFYENLVNFGKLTSISKNLYRLEYGSGMINYLGLMRFSYNLGDSIFKYTIYFEINSKLKRKGFTKLLSERGSDPFERIGNYSFAKYDDNQLIESYGKFQYLSSFNPTRVDNLEFVDSTFLGFNHIVLVKPHSTFVLSRRVPSFLDILAPFSYIVLFIFLIFLIINLLVHGHFDYKVLIQTFAARLQLIVLIILIVSFMCIGLLSIYNLTKVNIDKNNQRILEISNSLQFEFSSKTKALNTQNAYFDDYMQELVMKFANVFESDINLYNLKGYLIASSRPEMFKREIVSKLMNPIAFKALKFDNKTKIIVNESIGSLSYSSAYVPIRNEKNQIIAYLNLPYFARHAELRNEISTFLMTLLNVYAVFVILAIGLILIITRYITRPLTMIKNTMQGIKLQGINSHIEWNRNDEIGQLVQQYNRMIDELSKSANKLAKSERELAWREMAKQVAHEIKNPLTPMKLSIQHVLRAWKDGAPDMDDKLKKLSDTLIQQIDTLSDIATSFSDFADMPKLVIEKVNCSEVIQNAINLYQNNTPVQFIISIENNCDYFVHADKNQLLRVFNNLIKNAVQAVDNKNDGKISVEVSNLNGLVFINIEDNGVGIPDEIKNKIFVPNFTTKSSGAGLGLAMAKNIIIGFGGSIEYESTFGKGTKFKLSLKEFIDEK